METPQLKKPFGLTSDDVKLIRKIMLGAIAGEKVELAEDEVVHAARLIHRLGRIS